MHPAVAEIIELNEWYEQWVRGDITGDAFARFEEALHPAFTMTSASGDDIDRAASVEAMRPHQDRGLDFRVAIEDPAVLHESDDHVVCSYTEARQWPEGGSRRRSTVVFIKDPAGPNGLRWLRVHETLVDSG